MTIYTEVGFTKTDHKLSLDPFVICRALKFNFAEWFDFHRTEF